MGAGDLRLQAVSLIRDPNIAFATFCSKNQLPRRRQPGPGRRVNPGHAISVPDLSRGFRALKIWMSLSAYGSNAFGAIVDATCALAKHLENTRQRQRPPGTRCPGIT